MEMKWTKQALEGFNNIHSQYFTFAETVEYKKSLVKKIEEKILLLGTSFPVEDFEWKVTYKIIVDKYFVYYSFSEDRTICYIEYFKHFRQNK